MNDYNIQHPRYIVTEIFVPSPWIKSTNSWIMKELVTHLWKNWLLQVRYLGTWFRLTDNWDMTLDVAIDVKRQANKQTKQKKNHNNLKYLK